MSNRRNKDSEFLIQVKTLLGSALNSKDASYLPYVGADWIDAETTAGLKFMIDNNLIKKQSLQEKVKLILKYNEERRKAYFMTLGSDVLTKLAYLVGESHNVRSATERIRYPT